jgi:hypothetical protein
MKVRFSLSDLDKPEDEGYIFLQYSQDIESVCEFVGLDKEYSKDITGAVVVALDGDYEAVWLSESSRPYDISSTYYALPFYLDDEKNINYELLPYYWKKENEYYQ